MVFQMATSFPQTHVVLQNHVVQQPQWVVKTLMSPTSTPRTSSAFSSPGKYSVSSSPTWSPSVSKRSFIARHTCHESISENYEDVRLIGTGNFGSITLVKDRVTGQERVRKVMSTSGKSQTELTLMKKEADLLAALDHPQVVKLYEFAEDVARQELILILEYIPGGSCDDLLSKSGGHLSEALVARLVYQLLLALAHSHAQGIAHRDVKPDNLMLTSPGFLRAPDCKLIDFGLAAHEHGNDMKFVVGTPPYMAPEVVQFTPYTTRADIWSAGMTTLKLLTGLSPFEVDGCGQAQVFAMIKRYNCLDDFDLGTNAVWQGCSDDCKDFLGMMLSKDSRSRPSALQALDHPWLSPHEPTTRKLTNAMAQGLESYSSTSSAIRCCSLIVAAHLNPEEEEAFSQAFLGADVDGDGIISRAEIVDALDDVVQGWWDPKVDVDVDTVLESTEMRSDGMCYTEFLAACLFVGQCNSLVRRAFHALDHDSDGFVRLDRIQTLFDLRDWPFLQGLPQDRPFSLGEWITCVQGYSFRSGSDVAGSAKIRQLKVVQRRPRHHCF